MVKRFGYLVHIDYHSYLVIMVIMVIQLSHTTCVCSNIESSIQLQLCSYVHTWTNETHSLALTQDLITTLADNL